MSKVEIILTRDLLFDECRNCKGSGRIMNPKTDEYDMNCYSCNDNCEEPSEFGYAVLELVGYKWNQP